MNFTEPQPLTTLIDKLDAKTPIGSAMRTAEWERVPQGLRDGAFFSAGVTHTQFLAQQQKAVTDIIARAKETNAAGESMWKMDRGQFVKQLRQMGEALGVQHPTGREGGIKERDITDPLSIARLNLVVNTQLELAYGYGQYVAAMDEDVLQEWPAWELVRITPRKAPRDWDKRWSEAGGELHDGRMIALKTSPIWSKLSRFGNPHPPFDFNSGMGVEEVDRDTAEEFGLMSMTTNEALLQLGTTGKKRGRFRAAAPTHQNHGLKAFQEALQASVKDVSPALRQQLKGIFKDKINIDGDTAQWAQNAPENDDLVKVRDARPEPQTPPEKIPAKKQAPKKQTKEDHAAAFAAEFGCKVEFTSPAGKTKWGARMGKAAAIKHMQLIAAEWRRIRAAFPALAKASSVNTFLCVDSKRGRAHRDGPAPSLSTKATEWKEQVFNNIERWNLLNGRSWSSTRKGSTVRDNFRHELAHTMSTPEIMRTFRADVLAGSGDLEWFRQHVSEYAATNDAEAIAEAFGIATREDYVRGTFPPALERFIFETMLGEKI